MAQRGSPARRGRCGVGIDLADPALPVAGTGSLSQVRASRRSRWRAAVLLGVQGLIALHIAHFAVAGRTLSPVEPSESMYTLELGFVNAGFIFFAVALLGTLIFGRFFCGWACHLVALQDACAWIMKKLGVRPRPFRSRLLALAPATVAFYMFGWPTLARIAAGDAAPPFPGFTNHLVTTSFWATFPGPLFTALTFLTCGFAAVYVLGSKGFCTYGCPYGALFGGFDRLAPGRIVVSDACEQCGHCTATCTSNVRVHEEVRLYGMVVDSGCMKCLDCVSVCPKGALSYSFARPALFVRKPAARPARRYGLGVAEEIFVAAVALAATLSFRGLYDGPPLLMSVGLGGITAFVALTLLRLAREPGVRVQNLALKAAGRMRAQGWAFAALAAGLILFTAHSGFVQWHRAWGRFHLQRTEAARADVLSGAFREKPYTERHGTSVTAALAHFSVADRWGLKDVPEIKLGLAWCHLLQGEPDAAEADVRAAVAMRPGDAALQQNLAEILLAQGRFPEAIDALSRRFALAPPTAAERFQFAGLLADAGRLDEAAREFAACVAATPDSAPARYNLGGVLRRLGRNDAAIEQLLAARRLDPQDADTEVELGLACMAAGRNAEALASLQRAVALAPDSPEARMHLPELIRQLEAALTR